MMSTKTCNGRSTICCCVKKIVRVCRAADVDGDGFITPTELRAAYEQDKYVKQQLYGIGIGARDVEAALELADTDDSGNVNYDEFASMLLSAKNMTMGSIMMELRLHSIRSVEVIRREIEPIAEIARKLYRNGSPSTCRKTYESVDSCVSDSARSLYSLRHCETEMGAVRACETEMGAIRACETEKASFGCIKGGTCTSVDIRVPPETPDTLHTLSDTKTETSAAKYDTVDSANKVDHQRTLPHINIATLIPGHRMIQNKLVRNNVRSVGSGEIAI